MNLTTHRNICLLWACLLGLAGNAAAEPVPAESAPQWMLAENPEIYPLEKIQRGQIAQGISVFSSANGPEVFQAEVLGVMEKFFGPAGDLIIAKLSGGPVDKTGVVAGMSGSPVFIDRKLVGAVGYRFGAFTKDAIAGITPMTLMKTTFDDAPPRARSNSKGVPETKWGKAEPLATPIMAAGLLPEVIEAFADRFRTRGIGDLMPALSGGSGSAKGGEPHFFPGGPIATTLVDGDIKMAGIGTVTWVQGDRFLAFGHPFMGLGRIHMPVSYANIITTVASESGSWKLGRPTTPAGVLTDDRIYAIGGTSAEKASTVPVKVSVAGAGFGLAGEQETFAYQIAKHPTDLPVFAAVVTANTLTSRNQRPQGGTVEIRGTATLSGGLKLPIDDVVVSHRSSPAMQAAFRLMDALGDALNYELAEVDLAALDLKVRHRDDIDYAEIVGVRWDGQLRAGETVPVWVQVKPFQRDLEEVRVRVKIPLGASAGSFHLAVLDRMGYRRHAQRQGFLHRTDNLESHLAQRQRLPSRQEMTLVLVGADDGLRVQDRNIQGLPVRLKRLMKNGGGTVHRSGEPRFFELGRFSRRGVISGEVSTKVRVLQAPEKEWR